MRSLSALSLALVVFALPAFAEGGGELKVDASKVGAPKAPTSPMSREDMMRKGAEVSRGYYKALIQGQFETAASFLHPDTVEPLRRSLVDEIEKSPAAKQKAIFGALGVPDLNTLRTMPAGKFFAAYAQSNYGKSLRSLSDPKISLRALVEDQTCFPEKGWCAVTVRLKGKREDQSPISIVNRVHVIESGGRWLVTEKPPAG